MEDTKRPRPGAPGDAAAPGDGATVTGPAVSGAAGLSTLPPTMPGTSFPEGAAPIMATVTGGPIPDVAPPSMPPPGRYELGAEIARGGMGRVVEATDTLLGRVVAFKEALSADADVLRRFARETRITARLEHPSIVPLHDAGETTGGTPFYVMRKISGRPLEHLVAMAETLNQRLVLVPHIVAAAHAIAHAHARGIVHRDIKPSNILVGELGETIVIDWGLAKVIGEADEPARMDLSPSSSMMAAPAIASVAAIARSTAGREALDTDAIKTRAGIVYGTPGFMAPEQLRGHPVTERCDVYALGATLYHLLSRKPPHHARTADEMMKAAARHPATPIATLVPGVPAELSTIVDKALAHDPQQRYADARALAEDLQRFLSGQLVRSHHYSPRERIVRFVRKHRVPVIVSAAAAITLLVGGAIAVTSVIDERDRADAQRRVAEQAHAEAVRRADRLTLTQARSEAVQNPTLAIAMVKPLAAQYWPEVRTIAAAARAHGIVRGMPASKTTTSLELSRDGTRALAAGDDGAVRIYDLPKRTWRALAAGIGAGAKARFADEERRIVVWRERELAVIDAASGAASRVTAPTTIVDLEVAGITAYWIDDQRKLWRLDLAGAAPVEIPLPEPVTQVAPSPDGRFVALYGSDHLLFLDRTQPAAPPIELTIGRTVAFDWSTDGSAFGALVDEHAILGSTEDGPHIVQRNFVGARFYVVHGNDQLYTFGPTGVGMVSRENIAPRKQVDGRPVGLREARGGEIVAGSSDRIVVLSPFGDRALAVPAGKLEHLDAHPRSPYVVGAIEGQLLVWNLDDLEPRRIGDGRPGPMQLLGSGHALVELAGAGTQWIDLASGKATPLGEWSLQAAAASPSGHLACAIDPDRRARLLAPGREPILLDGQFDAAGFATDNDLLLGSGAAGTVHLYDTRDGKRTTLVSSRGKLLDLAWSRAAPAWAAALFGDHTLWRRNLVTGADATLANVKTAIHAQVLPDGTVLFAEDRSIRAWRPSGTIDTHADLPRPVVTIGLAGPGHLLAILDDDSPWLVDLAARNRVEPTASVGTTARPDDGKKQDRVALSIAAETGTLLVPNNGGIDVVDPLRRHSWTLAVQPPAPSLYDPRTASYSHPRISADGTRVVARLVDARRLVDELVTWSITVPGNGAETARWVDSLTNATIDPQRSNELIWR